MDALKAYATELGIESFDLDSLITSHRYLRGLNLDHADVWRKEFEAGRERGYSDGKSKAMEQDFLSLERLRGMTLGDLSILLSDPQS